MGGSAHLINGVATLTSSLLKKGNRQLSASDAGDAYNLASVRLRLAQ